MKKRNDLIFLNSLILLNEYKVCVEIGVATGLGTEQICKAAEENGGYVCAFDIWDTYGLKKEYPSPCTLEKVKFKLESKGFSRFTLVQIDTIKERGRFEKELDKLCPDGIDFAFIDGDHSYLGIRNDFSVVYPRLRKNGIIALHDTLDQSGCREFLVDLRTRYNDGTFDIVDFPFYIGVDPVGLTLLVKRTYPVLDFPIHYNCGGTTTPKEIEMRELEWFDSEVSGKENNMEGLDESVNILMEARWGRFNERKKFE